MYIAFFSLRIVAIPKLLYISKIHKWCWRLRTIDNITTKLRKRHATNTSSRSTVHITSVSVRWAQSVVWFRIYSICYGSQLGESRAVGFIRALCTYLCKCAYSVWTLRVSIRFPIGFMYRLELCVLRSFVAAPSQFIHVPNFRISLSRSNTTYSYYCICLKLLNYNLCSESEKVVNWGFYYELKLKMWINWIYF